MVVFLGILYRLSCRPPQTSSFTVASSRQSTGDTVMTHSFLFSSLVCPLNSSLIHLTAYLWADIPQQLKLNTGTYTNSGPSSRIVPPRLPFPLVNGT